MASPDPKQLSGALARDRARAAALAENVSRETWARLEQFAELLLRWQASTNLVAASTLPHLWTRHIADSLQLLPLAPKAKTWVDLGAGAGFPGLVIACALAETPDAEVHLVESNQKKASFLREAVRTLSLPAIVHARRIEDFAAEHAKAGGRRHGPRAGATRPPHRLRNSVVENRCGGSVSKGTRCRG